MGTITVVVSDELEREIRRLMSEGGRARRGALSEFVERALWAYIRSLRARRRVFRAVEGGRVVAEAKSLYELAEKLREMGMDPRGARIISPPPRPRRRIGLRGERA